MGANGQEKLKKTTKGWQLSVLWRDGSITWVPLKELKNSNPVEVAEYAVANRLVDEPAFAWWVPHVLRRRNRIISKVKTKYWRTTHKFGVQLPKTVEEALQSISKAGSYISDVGLADLYVVLSEASTDRRGPSKS